MFTTEAPIPLSHVGCAPTVWRTTMRAEIDKLRRLLVEGASILKDERALRFLLEQEVSDLRSWLKIAEGDRDLARKYGESAYGHDVACLELAETYEGGRSRDLGALARLLEYVLTPPIPPPWETTNGKT